MIRLTKRGLYAIVDTALTARENRVTYAHAVLTGGAVMLQYRDKSVDAARRKDEAIALRDLCRVHDALFIVNDDVELAVETNADGVHLGRDDMPPMEARALLGDERIIGVSCYDDIARARLSAAQGVNYVAFGSFYPSRTKPDAVRAHRNLIKLARDELDLAIVAIGGITTQNARPLVESGVDLLAVIRDLAEADDPHAKATSFARVFTENEREVRIQ